MAAVSDRAVTQVSGTLFIYEEFDIEPCIYSTEMYTYVSGDKTCETTSLTSAGISEFRA